MLVAAEPVHFNGGGTAATRNAIKKQLNYKLTFSKSCKCIMKLIIISYVATCILSEIYIKVVMCISKVKDKL